MPITISSSQSGASAPSGPMSPSTFATLRAKRKLACVGMPDGGFAMPTTWTPPCSTTSPALVSSQLPPWSAAMSTTTAPLATPSTTDVVSSTGALRPGTAAVVMTTSGRPTSSASVAPWRSSSSGVSSVRSRPPPRPRRRCRGGGAEALGLLLGRGPDVVGLHDRTESAAVAIDGRPATPTPITSTLAGAPCRRPS